MRAGRRYKGGVESGTAEAEAPAKSDRFEYVEPSNGAHPFPLPLPLPLPPLTLTPTPTLSLSQNGTVFLISSGVPRAPSSPTEPTVTWPLTFSR